MISIRFAVALMLVGAGVPVDAAHAAEDNLAAGTLIRVHTEEADATTPEPGRGRQWVGYVVEDDGDSILLRLRNRQKTLRLRRGELRSLDIGHREKARRWRGAGRGLATGAVIGAVAGAVLMALDNKDRCPPDEACLDLDFHPVVGAVGGAVYGAPIGAVVGAVAADGRTVWKPASIERQAVFTPAVEGFRPRRSGYGIAVGLTF